MPAEWFIATRGARIGQVTSDASVQGHKLAHAGDTDSYDDGSELPEALRSRTIRVRARKPA